IAAELKVHKSTAFRLVTTLERHNLVEQRGERGRYRLGVGVLTLAGAVTTRLDLVQRGRPAVEWLAERTGETVNITVLSDGAALYVDQVTGGGAIGTHNWVGQRIPLHATSNGKVLLAHLPAAGFAELLHKPLARFTERTIADPAALRAEIGLVRRRGFAVAVDELETGLTAVAAPIAEADGRVAASVSVSGPTFRLPADRVAGLSEHVIEAGRRISRSLGWPGPEGRVGEGRRAGR
ncbi:MAG TPA: IclR family transcriptional regulator, partial [Amycolatopsis sp.]|nr:IclR family transcriptional regulator [Amycolatopsis sp.]